MWNKGTSFSMGENEKKIGRIRGIPPIQKIDHKACEWIKIRNNLEHLASRCFQKSVT